MNGQCGKCKDRCLAKVRVAGNCAGSSAINLDTLPEASGKLCRMTGLLSYAWFEPCNTSK